MTGMSVIHSIRCMRKEGASVAAIARELGISEPTVRKYLREVDLSDRPPVRRERPSKICFASMSFQQAHQYFSAVWADGFPRSRHHAVSDVR